MCKGNYPGLGALSIAIDFSPLELRVEGQLVKVIYEAALRTLPDHQTTNFEKNETVINGLVNHEAYVKTNFSLEKSELSRLKHADGMYLNLRYLVLYL